MSTKLYQARCQITTIPSLEREEFVPVRVPHWTLPDAVHAELCKTVFKGRHIDYHEDNFCVDIYPYSRIVRAMYWRVDWPLDNGEWMQDYITSWINIQKARAGSGLDRTKLEKITCSYVGQENLAKIIAGNLESGENTQLITEVTDVDIN